MIKISTLKPFFAPFRKKLPTPNLYRNRIAQVSGSKMNGSVALTRILFGALAAKHNFKIKMSFIFEQTEQTDSKAGRFPAFVK